MKEKNLSKLMGQAVNDYNMIKDGDQIAVGISGGPDSVALISLLEFRRRIIPIDYRLFPVMVDTHGAENAVQNENIKRIEDFLQTRFSLPLHRIDLPIMDYLKEHPKNICFKCAQIRRTELFKFAGKMNCNKIALGHHKDDMVETILMNMLCKRELSCMMPRLPLFDGDLEIIRPLIYLEKSQILRYISDSKSPIIEKTEAEAACPAKTEKKDEQTLRRDHIREMMPMLTKSFPNFKNNLFAAFRSPHQDYLLDRLFDPKTSGQYKRP